MVKNVVTDKSFLSLPSSPATIDDIKVGNDLFETLRLNRYRCVGMAANMIGVNKRIIAFVEEKTNQIIVMYNPTILSKEEPYQVKEGCLCHQGETEVTRFKKIKVQFTGSDFKIKIKTYTDFTAEVIQHELDHLEGILV